MMLVSVRCIIAGLKLSNEDSRHAPVKPRRYNKEITARLDKKGLA